MHDALYAHRSVYLSPDRADRAESSVMRYARAVRNSPQEFKKPFHPSASFTAVLMCVSAPLLRFWRDWHRFFCALSYTQSSQSTMYRRNRDRVEHRMYSCKLLWYAASPPSLHLPAAARLTMCRKSLRASPCFDFRFPRLRPGDGIIEQPMRATRPATHCMLVSISGCKHRQVGLPSEFLRRRSWAVSDSPCV